MSGTLHEPTARTLPEPLGRTAPAPEPYPLEALGDILGGAARALHEIVQAPAALCAQSIMAGASLAAQAHANVVVYGPAIPLTLWAVTIAESGTRKTGADIIALAAHRAHEKLRLQQRDVATREHRLVHKAWEIASQHAERKAKGKSQEEIRSILAALGDEPVLPPPAVLLCREPTVEGIQRLYLEGAPSLGIFTDEGGEFIGGHSMNRERVVRTVAAMSTLWSDGMTDRIRGGDGAHKIYGVRLAMHVMAQPVLAETVLADPLMAGQGFLARALMVWPTSTAGTRRFRDTDPAKDPRVVAYHERITELLRRPPRLTVGSRCELDPRSLTLTPAAKRLWETFHNDIEGGQAPGGRYAGVPAWASKAAEQVARIAGVMALIESPDCHDVTAPQIERAATLMRFYLGEAVRLIDTSAVPAKVRDAMTVLAWCHDKGHQRVDFTLLLQEGPNALRDRDRLKTALAVLVETGNAQPLEHVDVKGRHSRKAWAIAPAARPAASSASPASVAAVPSNSSDSSGGATVAAAPAGMGQPRTAAAVDQRGGEAFDL